MISLDVQQIQADYLSISDSWISLRQWMRQFIIQLLQITHGQWVYRNEVVHNANTGTQRTEKKRRLQERIDAEVERGVEHLRPEDDHLMLAPLEDIATSSGERHEYWLLAVETARRLGEMSMLDPTGIG